MITPRTTHPWQRTIGCLLLVLCALIGLTAAARAQDSAFVTTDQLDYPPGSTVYITGSGFSPGETVQCQVLTLTQPNDDATSPAHQPWTTTADDSGNINTTWLVPADQDELGATLQLTATGQTSGLIAQTTFTDNVQLSTAVNGLGISADTAANSSNPVGGSFTTLAIVGGQNAGASFVINETGGGKA